MKTRGKIITASASCVILLFVTWVYGTAYIDAQKGDYIFYTGYIFVIVKPGTRVQKLNYFLSNPIHLLNKTTQKS